MEKGTLRQFMENECLFSCCFEKIDSLFNDIFEKNNIDVNKNLFHLYFSIK